MATLTKAAINRIIGKHVYPRTSVYCVYLEGARGGGSVYEINTNKQIAFICAYLCLSCLRGTGAVYGACGAGGGGMI